MRQNDEAQARLDEALAQIAVLQAELEVIKAELEVVKDLAATDPLTGLLNRRGLDDEGRRMLAHLMRVNRNGASEDISVIYVDLDAFKGINDCHGHFVADQVLCTAANAIVENLRQGEDLLARVGGDEFVALLVGGKVAVEALTTRISDKLWITLPGSGAPIQIRMSIGCICFNGTVSSSFNKGSEEEGLSSTCAPLDMAPPLSPSRQELERVLKELLDLAEEQMRLAKARRGAGR